MSEAMGKTYRVLIPVLIGFLAAGCVPGIAIPTAAPLSPTITSTVFVPPTDTPEPPTIIVSPSPTWTATATPTPTPDVYWQYTIDYLSERSYGVGEIEVLEVLASNFWFTRYLIRYSSDDLWIYGFLNVPIDGGPSGNGPFPVIIALHGYIDPTIYNTIDYTTGYADSLARAGYIVFHPNLRGYPPSDDGDNLFRVGMAIDVLNLIALIKEKGQDADVLADMDSSRIGLWGHSMGGGVSTRVLTVSRDVDGAVLYAAMSGDERQNFEAINGWSDGLRGLDELAVPVEELDRISPIYYFDRITAAVSIHHGRSDLLVPPAWSEQTCSRMAQLRINVACTFYNGMPHTFIGEGEQIFIQNTILFFDEVLKSR